MNKSPISPGEAKEVWDSLDKPSSRKVSARFTAAGRPVGDRTIARWKSDGWTGTTAANIVKAADASVAAIDSAVPALTGDVRSTMADIVAAKAAEARTAEANAAEANAAEASAPADTRGNAQRSEDALRKVISGAVAVWERIQRAATVQPNKSDTAGEDAMSMPPDGLAKVMTAASLAISRAIDDFRKVSVLRTEEAAAVPGTQTVYPPGQGPYAESSHADGLHGERDYPSRSAIEAIDQALKEFREQKA
jgi:hypothetical protein